MPVIDNAAAPEIPWRPGYRVFPLAGPAQGVATATSRAEIQPGAGAPLHIHTDLDEVLIVTAGMLELRIGEARQMVGPDHTIAIPAGTPHGFVAVGSEPARTFTFFARTGAFASTVFLEGEPPAGGALR
ncbi:cupin [Siccirubricoccus deserti]|uniref:Cupin domain-containing protein n=1 Tax=Siccirubricoccus deserti TaxID=2013562 RepID=A0A9X0QWB7_9PROT|nr:cupin domain-containing protein [Siccirubricoccus deserti]MBC4013787.1 cupin domain-containing protein [Siccirubricoccus deserti]GGC29447.1 cupin [Siccirubricoccus deserti]